MLRLTRHLRIALFRANGSVGASPFRLPMSGRQDSPIIPPTTVTDCGRNPHGQVSGSEVEGIEASQRAQ